jgi:putative hydrolase of the HAD superfamily
MSVITSPARTAPDPARAVVVFDIGGVLVEVDDAACPEHLAAAAGREPEQVAKLLHGSGLYDRFDTGDLNFDDLRRELRQVLDAPRLTSKQVSAAWQASIKTVCPVLAPIAARLGAAGRLAYASNNNPIHFPIVRERLSAAGVPDNVPALLSFEIGVRKPDAEFYLGIKQLPIGACLVFIDDRIDNVIAAEKVGLPAWHHTDPQATAELLHRLGVLGGVDAEPPGAHGAAGPV